MAYLLTSDIRIGKYKLDGAHKVEIADGWEDIASTCTIELPNLSGQLERAFAVGDLVSVSLGYDGDNPLLFEGYVSEVTPSIPFQVKAEDRVFQLKRKAVGGGSGASWKSIKLRDLLSFLMDGIEVELSGSIPDVTLAPFRIEQGVTVAEVLQKLKETYRFCAYFRGSRLYVGLPYTEFDGRQLPVVKYHFQQNIVSDSLAYRRKQDTRLRAKVISVLPNGQRLETEVGDADGETRTIHLRGVKEVGEMKKIATAELERYKYDGYRGDFTAFGIPDCRHSWGVEITDERYPERAGRYVVDKVVTRWGVDGFRRTLTIGRKI